MKDFQKWRYLSILAVLVSVFFIVYGILHTSWLVAGVALLIAVLFIASFYGFWLTAEKQGFQTDVEISRFLGKDAAGALSFGNIGLLTYDEEYIVTWTSDFFKERNIELVNQKVTAWIPETRTLFEDEVDYVLGESDDSFYEITRKTDSNVLYVQDVTSYQKLSNQYMNNSVVVGVMQLDNYMEYQSYENEELMATINTHLRGPLITWAKENGMLIRRLRSDRFFLVLNKHIFDEVTKSNFSILQITKDEANQLDLSISLSMAFAYGTNDFNELDDMVNQLIELAQSRGGDQVAFRNADGNVRYIGGNSESGSTRSKVRVHTIAQSIQGAIMDAQAVFIAGHNDTDFDCMGAALGISSWAKSLGKKAYIVLRDVPRDIQLQETMDSFRQTLIDRHRFVTPEEAGEMMDRQKDVLFMVDHGVPAISSARNFLDSCQNIIVIDHHRRGDSFVEHTMLTYIESTASSACELIVELIQNIPNHVPIYETEATIMYLGILVDTNRFKMHTDARTFEAASRLRSWGANAAMAEKALCVDYEEFSTKNHLIDQAEWYHDRFMIVCIDREPVEKTMLAKVAQSLLLIRGVQASFAIARVKGKEKATAISARSDGSFNVQKIVECLNGGGHFTAAAVERMDVTPLELKTRLLEILEEEKDESNLT